VQARTYVCTSLTALDVSPEPQEDDAILHRRTGQSERRADVGEFLTDVQEIRQRARKHIEQGAVTQAYRANREVVLKLLNEALATEIVCVLRYKRHYFMAIGINAQPVADEFLQHANEEQGHADQISTRITQLGGEPNWNPDGLQSRSHSEYVEGKSLVDMIREDLVAERVAIDSYSEMIRYVGDDDPTTRRMLEGILAVEEEHAEDLATMLATRPGGGGGGRSSGTAAKVKERTGGRSKARRRRRR
jgi:bacterioferritin